MTVFFFFQQKTAYELRISDWSSYVCSSDLRYGIQAGSQASKRMMEQMLCISSSPMGVPVGSTMTWPATFIVPRSINPACGYRSLNGFMPWQPGQKYFRASTFSRSEEHTSELQSLMRISYAVFCLKKKKKS